MIQTVIVKTYLSHQFEVVYIYIYIANVSVL